MLGELNCDEAEATAPFEANATFVRAPGVGVTLGVGVAVGVGVGVTGVEAETTTLFVPLKPLLSVTVKDAVNVPAEL